MNYLSNLTMGVKRNTFINGAPPRPCIREKCDCELLFCSEAVLTAPIWQRWTFPQLCGGGGMMSGLRDSCLLNFEVAACSSLDPGTLWSAATETVTNIMAKFSRFLALKFLFKPELYKGSRSQASFFCGGGGELFHFVLI